MSHLVLVQVRSTVLITMLALFTLVSGAHGRVIYFNDFEKGQGETPAGVSHYLSPQSVGSFEWRHDPQQAHSGLRSLWMENHGPRTTLWQVPIRAVGGAVYRISVWANNGPGKGTTYIAVRCKDTAGKWISDSDSDSKREDIFLQGETGWQRLTFEVRVPSSTDTMHVFLSNRYGQGDQVWFDDLQVEEFVIDTFNSTAPELKHALEPAKDDPQVGARITAYLDRLAPLSGAAQQANLSVERRREMWSALVDGTQLRRSLERTRFIDDLRANVGDLAAIWVDSLERVFIDDMPIEGEVAKTGRIEMFPGEEEAIQLVLVPMRDIENVTVRITPQDSAAGVLNDAASWRVVGYVKIDKPAMNHRQDTPFPYSGWWPDPLLPMERFSLEQETFQPIWIQVDLPRSVSPGSYPLTTEVVDADGKVLAASDLVVEVLPGQLPERWHMKKVLGFSERLARDSLSSWLRHPGGAVKYGDRWDEVSPRFHEMLLKYRIGIGSWYDYVDSYPPALLQWARERGQNFFFHSTGLLARYNDDGELVVRPGDVNRVLNVTIPFLKQHDLLDMTWVFGFDEQWGEAFDLAHQTFSRIKETGAITATTIKDYSYGTQTPLGESVDVFIPSLHTSFDLELARQARAMGNQVAWYSTRDFNIETDTIHARLIPWRTMAEGSEGYLIWAMNRWVGNDQFVGDQVRTTWNAQLDGVTPSSSAMMIYPGEDGPVASIRLEQFRDGVEDYDLLMELAIARYPSQQPVEAGMQFLRDLGLAGDARMWSAQQIREARRKVSQMHAK